MEEENKKKTWLKNLGWGAIAFFTIKGLVWLAVFFGLFQYLGC
jgi:hypothetical protein